VDEARRPYTTSIDTHLRHEYEQERRNHWIWEGRQGTSTRPAFNTIFAQHMSRGSVAGQQLSVFAASDDEAARKAVLELGKALGFDAIDAGPLKNARHLEAIGYFNIQLGYVLGNGPDTGFKYVHS
jgi:predicted dinucleotide-binding enzyme